MTPNARVVFLVLFLGLAACQPPPTTVPTHAPKLTLTLAPLPTATVPLRPTLTATATQAIEGNLFSKISRSSSVLYLHCYPSEIIFDVTAKNSKVSGVVLFFRIKDKPTGLTNDWSSGGNLRPVGNQMFEIVFRAEAIPLAARYWDAWLQYQFVGLDQSGNSLGRTQIFSEEVSYAPDCP